MSKAVATRRIVTAASPSDLRISRAVSTTASSLSGGFAGRSRVERWAVAVTVPAPFGENESDRCSRDAASERTAFLANIVRPA